MADGLDEARRGLWRSAIESFEAAASDDPRDFAPVLAKAVCLLKLGDPEAAMVWLETATCVRRQPSPPSPWRDRLAWLTAAARLAAGDPLGAELAASSLASSQSLRVEAHTRLAAGDYQAGVRALLAAHRKVRRPRP